MFCIFVMKECASTDGRGDYQYVRSTLSSSEAAEFLREHQGNPYVSRKVLVYTPNNEYSCYNANDIEGD